MCSVEMPENKIHETAIIHPTAVLGKGIEVGPYAVIDAETVIGDGCKIGPHAVIHKYTTIGKNCTFFPGCSIGADPQNLKMKNLIPLLAMAVLSVNVVLLTEQLAKAMKLALAIIF